MNLGSLIEQCQFRTGFNASSYNTRWIAFLNDGIRRYAIKYPWPGLETLLDMTTNGSRYLIFPHYVEDVISILNRSQNIPVDRIGQLDRQSPWITAARTPGTVIGYESAGTVPCLQDPSGYLYIQSTNASDVSDSATVNVTGYVSASGASGTGLERVYITESIYPAGTTAVTLTNQFASIVSISKVTETWGDFYFYDAGNSNAHISYIPRRDTTSGFMRKRLQYVPSAQTILECRVRHKVQPIREVHEAPHPSINTDWLITHAVRRFWQAQQQYTKAQIERQENIEHLQDVAAQQENFSEPFSRIIPDMPPEEPDLRIEWR